MKSKLVPILVLVLLVTACGDDDGGGAASDGESSDDAATAPVDTAESDAGDGGNGGGVVDAPPPGQAVATVDGQEFVFDLPGGLACEVSDDEFSFSFRIGDNEVVVGGGATRSDDEWFGSMSVQIVGDDGVTEYSANILENPTAIAVDGDSASYTGPMQKFTPTNDGSAAEPEDVGTGTISFTCA